MVDSVLMCCLSKNNQVKTRALLVVMKKNPLLSKKMIMVQAVFQDPGQEASPSSTSRDTLTTSATTTPMTESNGEKPMVHTAVSAATDHTKEPTSTLLTLATLNPVPLLRHTQARPNAFARHLNLCPSNPTSHRFENALTWKAGYHLAPTSLASTLSSRATPPTKRSGQSLAAALSIFHRQVCFLLATAHFLRQNG